MAKCAPDAIRCDFPRLMIVLAIHNTCSSRTKFMVETLVNLKNNKFRRGGHGGFVFHGEDALERMRKFLRSLSKKRHSASTFLCVDRQRTDYDHRQSTHLSLSG